MHVDADYNYFVTLNSLLLWHDWVGMACTSTWTLDPNSLWSVHKRVHSAWEVRGKIIPGKEFMESRGMSGKKLFFH